MLKERTLGPVGVGDNEGESHSRRLDRQVDGLSGEDLIPVREERVTVRTVDSEAVDGEL